MSDKELSFLSVLFHEVAGRVDGASVVESERGPRLLFAEGDVELSMAVGLDGRERRVVIIHGRAPGSEQLTLEARRERFLDGFLKHLGTQDVQLGDAPFDAKYLVKSSQPVMTGLWLVPESRRLLLASLKADPKCFWDIELEDGELTLTSCGLELSTAGLEKALLGAKEIANAGVGISQQCRETAQSLGGSYRDSRSVWGCDGAAMITAREGDATFTVDWTSSWLAWQPERLVTRIRCDRSSLTWDRFILAAPELERVVRERKPRDLDPCGVFRDTLGDYACFCEDVHLLGARLSLALRKMLDRLPPLVIRAEQRELSCLLSGFEVEPERLKTCMELMELLRSRLDRKLSEQRRRVFIVTGTREREDRWKELAEATGGHLFSEAEDHALPTVHWELDGTLIQARVAPLWGRSGLVTTFETTAPGAGHLWFRIHDGMALDYWAKDNPEFRFEDHLPMQTNDPGALEHWLSDELRGAIFNIHVGETYPNIEITLNEERVVVTFGGFESGRSRLEGAHALCRASLRRSRDLLESWSALALSLGGRIESRGGALWGSSGGDAILLGETDIDVVITSMIEFEPQVTTRLKAPRGGGSGELLVALDQRDSELRNQVPDRRLKERHVLEREVGLPLRFYSDSTELLQAVKKPGLERAFIELTPAVTSMDSDGVTMWLRGFELDGRRLQAALELIEQLRFEPRLETIEGPYR